MLIYRAFQINNCHLEHFAPILSVDKMVQRVWLNKLMPLQYEMG